MAVLVGAVFPGGLGIMQAGAGGLDLGRQIGQPLDMNLMVIDALAVVGQAAAVLERLSADSLERVNDQAGLLECVGHAVLLMQAEECRENTTKEGACPASVDDGRTRFLFSDRPPPREVG